MQGSSSQDAALTLRDAFQRFHQTADHSKNYVIDVKKALDHWERCSPNPPLVAITNATMHEFKNRFMSEPLPPRSPKSKLTPRPPSAATAFKVLRTLGAILSTCGPSHYHNRYGLGIITTIPCTRPPKVPEPEVITASLEEISAIYDHCTVAKWPNGPVNAVDWWRCLVVFLFNIGSRRNDFLKLRRTQIDLDRMELRDRQQKNDRSDVKPINRTLAVHLQKIWLPARSRVFDCPNSKQLYRQWHAIQQAAGIYVDRPEHSIREHVYGFHELRKTCGTELLLVSPSAAQYQLGHGDMKTTEKHYGSKRRLMQSLRPAVDALPQPESFHTIEGLPTPPTSPAPSFFDVALAKAREAKAAAADEQKPSLRVVG